jgi:hypothetical protein
MLFSKLSGAPPRFAFHTLGNFPNCLSKQLKFTRDRLKRQAAASACINGVRGSPGVA